MNALQKATAQAIVNIFETGSALGAYGKVTLLEGDSGRLTYGRSQTTLASGNLYKLLRDYVEMPHARFGAELAEYLPPLEKQLPELDHDPRFRTLLRNAGVDPAMRRAQDAFFDRIYWKPAVRAASRIGIETPLGVTVVYDSHIHGSWGRVRRLTETKIGGIDAAGGEHTWITAYVTTRREWLASRRNAVLRRTVYRMDAFLKLIESDQWALPLPLDIRGVRISPSSLLSDSPREIANAPSTEASSPESANSDRPHTA